MAGQYLFFFQLLRYILAPYTHRHTYTFYQNLESGKYTYEVFQNQSFQQDEEVKIFEINRIIHFSQFLLKLDK